MREARTLDLRITQKLWDLRANQLRHHPSYDLSINNFFKKESMRMWKAKHVWAKEQALTKERDSWARVSSTIHYLPSSSTKRKTHTLSLLFFSLYKLFNQSKERDACLADEKTFLSDVFLGILYIYIYKYFILSLWKHLNLSIFLFFIFFLV